MKKKLIIPFLLTAFLMPLFTINAIASTDKADFSAITEFTTRGANCNGGIEKNSYEDKTKISFFTGSGAVNSSGWGAGFKRKESGYIDELDISMQIENLQTGAELILYFIKLNSNYPVAGAPAFTIGNILYVKLFRGDGIETVNGSVSDTDKIYINFGNGGRITPAVQHKTAVGYVENRYNMLSSALEYNYTENESFSLITEKQSDNSLKFLIKYGGNAVYQTAIPSSELNAVYGVADYASSPVEMGLAHYALSATDKAVDIYVEKFDDRVNKQYKQSISVMLNALNDYGVMVNSPDLLTKNDMDSLMSKREQIDYNSILLRSEDKYWIKQKFEDIEKYVSFNEIYKRIINNSVNGISALCEGETDYGTFYNIINKIESIDFYYSINGEILLSNNFINENKKIIDGYLDGILLKLKGNDAILYDYFDGKADELIAAVSDSELTAYIKIIKAQGIKQYIDLSYLSQSGADSITAKLQNCYDSLEALQNDFADEIITNMENSTKQDANLIGTTEKIKGYKSMLKSVNYTEDYSRRINAVNEYLSSNALSGFSTIYFDYDINAIPAEYRDYAEKTDDGIKFRVKRSDSNGARLCYDKGTAFENLNITLSVDYLPYVSDDRNNIEIFINLSKYKGGYINEKTFTDDGYKGYEGITLGFCPLITGGMDCNVYIDGNKVQTLLINRSGTPFDIEIDIEKNASLYEIKVNGYVFELSQGVTLDYEGGLCYISLGNYMNIAELGTEFTIKNIGDEVYYKTAVTPEPSEPPLPTTPPDGGGCGGCKGSAQITGAAVALMVLGALIFKLRRGQK